MLFRQVAQGDLDLLKPEDFDFRLDVRPCCSILSSPRHFPQPGLHAVLQRFPAQIE